jgi:hypothetical protein
VPLGRSGRERAAGNRSLPNWSVVRRCRDLEDPALSPAVTIEEEVRGAIAKECGRRLEACERLREFAVSLTEPWCGRALDEDRIEDLLVVVIFSRSTKTFWAATDLARTGFGDQAAMLNRSLFEDMVDAHWVTLEPELARQRLEEHDLHGRMLLAEAITNEGDVLPADEIPTFDPEERRRLDAIFGRYGHQSWTGAGLHDRVERIRHLWRDPKLAGLDFMRRIVHRENNQLLHLGAYSIAQQIRGRTNDTLTVKFGPNTDHVGNSLLAAFWIFGQTVSHVLSTFEVDCPDHWKAVYEDQFELFRPLDADAFRDVGRNDPCPCGSGRKYKRCHGA